VGVEHNPTHTALGVEAQRIVVLLPIRLWLNDAHEFGIGATVVGEWDQLAAITLLWGFLFALVSAIGLMSARKNRR